MIMIIIIVTDKQKNLNIEIFVVQFVRLEDPTC